VVLFFVKEVLVLAFDSHSNFIEIQKLRKELSAKSGNLVRYDISHVATEDGQTEFPIDLTSFDFLTDSVLVQSGRTLLSPTLDYSVLEHSVILNEGVPVGRTVDIYVYKNVVNLDEEQTISGLQIGVGTIPFDRLEELPIPVSAGGTGATTAKEALANLGAFSDYLGIVADANLLTWLNSQKTGGGFIVDPSVTIEDVPQIESWYSGIYDRGVGFVLVTDVIRKKVFFNCKRSGVWQDWVEIAIADKFLPLTGGTLGGDLTAPGIVINRTIDADSISQQVRPYAIKIGGINCSSITHDREKTTKVVLAFNEFGVGLYDRTGEQNKLNLLFGEHNTGLLASKVLNRSNAVNVANTSYTTLMARGTSLNSTETNPTVNGAIAWTYK
jgi:hypothetical protein